MNLSLFEELTFIATFIVLGVYSILRVLSGMRILQQSYYSNRRFLAWYEKRLPTLEEISIFTLTFIMVFYNTWVFHIISILMFTYFIISKEKGKIKLVITKHVLRLFVIFLIASAGFIILLVMALDVDRTPAIFINIVLSYFMLALINFLDKPINKLIKIVFIKKAKNRLKLQPKLNTIGITGSYGKTSTKNILTALLDVKTKTQCSPKSYNTPLGIAITINDYLEKDTNYLVCEMGAFKQGEIKELCDFVHPKYGILTTIGVQHLATFKTQKNIIETKFELIQSLPIDGIGVINIDNEYIEQHSKEFDCTLVTIGIDNQSAHYIAKEIRFAQGNMVFDLYINQKFISDIQTRLLGKHNVYNILASIALAHKLGVSIAQIKSALYKINPIEHRLESRKEGDLVILDDSYNSNPDGANYALEVLNYFKGKKYIITPGFVDLGVSQEYFNHQLGYNMVGKVDGVILVGIEGTEDVYRGLVNNKFIGEIYRVPTFEIGMKKFRELYNDQDAILLIENDLPDCYI